MWYCFGKSVKYIAWQNPKVFHIGGGFHRSRMSLYLRVPSKTRTLNRHRFKDLDQEESQFSDLGHPTTMNDWNNCDGGWIIETISNMEAAADNNWINNRPSGRADRPLDKIKSHVPTQCGKDCSSFALRSEHTLILNQSAQDTHKHFLGSSQNACPKRWMYKSTGHTIQIAVNENVWWRRSDIPWRSFFLVVSGC